MAVSDVSLLWWPLPYTLTLFLSKCSRSLVGGAQGMPIENTWALGFPGYKAMAGTLFFLLLIYPPATVLHTCPHTHASYTTNITNLNNS